MYVAVLRDGRLLIRQCSMSLRGPMIVLHVWRHGVLGNDRRDVVWSKLLGRSSYADTIQVTP